MRVVVAAVAAAVVDALGVAPPIEQVAWVRAREKGTRLGLETCSRRYESLVAGGEDFRGMRVDLTAVVHIAEPAYYEERLDTSCETLLYESIVPRDLVDAEARTLTVALGATPAARQVAATANLVAQGDALGQRAFEHGWVIADVAADDLGYVASAPFFLQSISDSLAAVDSRQSALLVACLLAPCPELTYALVGWSSTPKRPQRRRPLGGASYAGATFAAASTLAALRAAASAGLFNGGAETLARLSLLRSLVGRDSLSTTAAAAKNNNDKKVADPQIERRNDAVVDALRSAARAGSRHARVLYGAAHMRDLDVELRRLGFQRAREEDAEEWTPAFDLPIAPGGAQATDGLLVLGLVSFLGLDGADYAVTLLESVKSLEYGAPLLDQVPLLLGYLTRHAALYYALTKLVVE